MGCGLSLGFLVGCVGGWFVAKIALVIWHGSIMRFMDRTVGRLFDCFGLTTKFSRAARIATTWKR